MESFEKVEIKMKEDLKRICDNKGRETNIHKSATIFNQLGLLYKTKLPDKISLIQSAALLNAAILRQPSNQKFQDDLCDLCKNVLDCANVIQTDANLVHISKTAGEYVEKMRKNAQYCLEQIKQIPENVEKPTRLIMEQEYIANIEYLQRNVSSDYKNIMVFISQQCIKIMGRPPCKYAHVGMGSLARGEITPYSDFEHIIVMQNLSDTIKKQEQFYMKEYFRWYSVLFHIIVINLKETDLYSICVPCLNDHSVPDGNWFQDQITPQGISFDGMMPHACHFPLGKTQITDKYPWKTELIRSVDEMVKYFWVKDVKKGYKLGDLLTKTCFIDGDADIYQQFSEKVKLSLGQSKHQQHTNVIKQLEEDLENFAVGFNFASFMFMKSINLKRVIYRSITLLIPALSRLNGLDNNINSCFEIIKEFHCQAMISDTAAHRLSHSVAVACHARLFYYSSMKRQEDSICKELEHMGKEKLKELTKFVDHATLIRSLAITYVLQNLLKHSNGSLENFDESLQEFDFTTKLIVTMQLGLIDDCILACEIILATRSTFRRSDFMALQCLGMLYNFTQKYDKLAAMHEKYKPHIEELQEKNLQLYLQIKLNEWTNLLYFRKFSTVMKETDTALKSNMFFEKDLPEALLLNGDSKHMLKLHNEALSSYRDYLKLSNVRNTMQRAECFRSVSLSLIALGRRSQGMHWAYEGFNIVEMIGATEEVQHFFTDIIKNYT